MAKTIALDFDGVLHSYVSGWTGDVPTDPPIEGAKEFVQKLIDDGYQVYVLTTRAHTSEGLNGTEEWLKENGFPLLHVTDVKKPFIAMVDDRAVKFDPWEPNWEVARLHIDLIANRPKRTTDETKAKRTYKIDS